ncbi:DUF1631 family protein [Oceanicoccus sagamiensis]|uniref:Thymidine phosphorylase n=1 Tax=Oceanicoccus sagamiensis TaxID=716816 RepID=A0A1X9NFT4_9GAMM|nr:DUF1631 family protein [Oceanicoccus sagamiensis]ARN74735.1 hypothetical protein BST96_11755 [Oceanicoccus sagamiensis]
MELLNNCRDHAHKFYGDLLLAAEKTINDALFEQAEQCTNNEEQRRYFEAMQQLKDRSGAMHTAFRHEMGKSFQIFASGQEEEASVEEQIDIGNLSLVQRDELEDELAISVIVSKSNSRNSETLWKLNKRMAAMRGGKSVSDETNPFGPHRVCEALQMGVAELSLDNKTRILVYKQLGKIFVISFAKELDALNDILTEKGILPNLRFSVTKAQQSAAPQANATGDSSPEAAVTDTESLKESPSSIAHQQDLYNSIRALQSAVGNRTQTAGGVSFAGVATDGSGGEDSFSTMDYALALSAIQQSKAFLSAAALNRPLPAEKVEENLIDQLTKQGDENSRHKMTQGDADTVDLVGMIFRYMLDDPNLHDAVKSLLSHLHTPYLKLALMDKTFLDNYQHSARVLLNTMAEVGGKWVKKDNERTVLPKIKTIVENILKGFVDDPSVFDRLLEDFTRFKENIEKRSRMVEKRNTESQQGLEKLELSRQQASDEVDARLDIDDIPESVADLLRQPWIDFLAFNLLRHGQDSLTWESALKVVDGVMWSVKPSAVADNKDDFKRHQSDLEISVSDGLKTIGYDPDASKGLLNSLKEAQELAYHHSVMEAVNEPASAEVVETATRDTAVTNEAAVAVKPKATPLPNLKPNPERH